MAQRSFPFDAGAGATISETDWQKMARAMLATGVITGRLNQLAVTADGSALSVSAATGQAQVEGFFYENDSPLAIPLAAANATNPRIDTVVVRLDRTANTAVLAVVTGTAAASPVAPTLSATDTLFEMPLANVLVPAAAGVIVAGNVTDRRPFGRYYTAITANQSNIIANASLNGLILSWSPQPGRRYRATAVVHIGQTVGTDEFLLTLTDQSGPVQLQRDLFSNGTTSERVRTLTYVTTTSLTSGARVWQLNLARNAGSGSAFTEFGSTYPSFLLIEDIGAL